MNEKISIVKVASIYMATIVGAGFASGQEIVQFFSAYYEGGFFGIITAGILFSIIGYVVLDKVYRERIRNYEELLFPSVGWFMGWVIEIAVSLFMLSVFCVMITGAGSIFFDKLEIPFKYGIVLMTVICMLLIFTGIKGIVAISTVITPVLIAGILFVALYVIIFNDTSALSIYGYFAGITNNWFFSALLYVGYNSIISIVVMCSLLPHLKSRKIAASSGILGGMMLCLMALIINTIIYVFNPDMLLKELPLLSITEKYGGILNTVYALVLWLAMLISAVTSGYGFVERVAGKININKKIITIIICLLVIPMSRFGFSGLISTVYPLFGYVGLFLILVILTQDINLKWNRFFKKASVERRNK